MSEPQNFADARIYCMFVGYPRSGHTLIGSLLNAHPDVLISHELDALGLVEEGIDRQGLFERILARDEEFAQKGRKHIYDYAVEGKGAWHGRWRRLQVIGDKRGAKSSRWLYDRPDLLDTLAELVALPMRLIHVVRSPWDNIATMVRRGAPTPEAVAELLPSTTEHYFKLCESVRRVRERQPSPALLDVYHEDFVADPCQGLRALSDFLEVEWEEAWAEASSAIVYAKPHRSRFAIDWPADLVAEAQEEMKRFSWLRPDHHDFGEPTEEEAASRLATS